GVAKPVHAEAVVGAGAWGATRATVDGGWVWTAAVQSPGASGLRLRLRGLRLPADTELFAYTEAGALAGPFSGNGPRGTGELWLPALPGDTAYLQLRRYGPGGPEPTAQASFVLDAVGHLGAAFGAAAAGAKSFCDYNASCIVNLSCVEPAPAVADARDAVALMLFVDEPYLYACSGGLLNTTANDGTPYFLTANHCLSTGEVAATLETFFQWSVDCGAPCPEQWGTPIGVPSLLGAEVLATDRVGDYTLLRLDAAAAPPGTVLLGWTNEPVAFNHEQPLYRVSHPALAPQAYSEHRVDTGATACLQWPRGSWIYSRDVVGATEGGSSGSPVVNADGLVVGQLSGSCGLLAWFPCLSRWHATADGAFASYYGEVEPWLDPGSVCSDDDDGDGFIAVACGGDDCDDADPSVNPGADEVCDNGIDDDCDLAIDGEDPDCSLCLPAGAACSSGVECCSGRCRWLLRTCR
ncbi:MAG: trypsin-like peptidase domain-containing protein, partial [Thermoanaerobaculales bacterium]|nr:trypsin-like peptidase domain-containing protein [Thermoanaerobaculales bacterium]